MLSLGGFPPPLPSLRNTTPHETLSQSRHFPSKTHQTRLSFFSNGLTHHPFCPVLAHITTIFCVSASKSRKKGRDTLSPINSLDDKDTYDEEIDDDDDEEQEEEEEVIPLRNMKKWFENKPRGFGEGKVYDTSLEQNLAQEMEKSRKANKLKKNAEYSKGVLYKQKVESDLGASYWSFASPEDVPRGIRVHLVNLPKKKNVHRDLQLAFKEVSGIVDVIPAVSGNKKTRDPICRGFAFIDLKSKEDANRFVQKFSRQSITFGKIQKQVRFEIMKSKSPRSVHIYSTDGSYGAPQVAVPSFGESPDANFEIIADTSSDSLELISSEEAEDEDDGHVLAQWEEGGENLGSFTISEHSVGDPLGAETGSNMDSIPSKQTEEVRANGKKPKAKRKRTKFPKLTIPGSANRLRIKDKTVLTGVLSKYAVQAASTSKGKQ